MKKMLKFFMFSLLCIFSCFYLTACDNINNPKEYKIVFMVDDEEYHTITTSGKSIIKLPENPSKDGYTFDGWYLDKDVWKDSFVASTLQNTLLTDDIEVYAKFNEVHSLTHHIKVEPKCTEKGMEEYWDCEGCGKKFSNATATTEITYPQEIAALDHNPVIDAAVESTCTSTGLTTGMHCDRCNMVYIAQEETSMKQHSYTNMIVDEKYLATPADCNKAARYFYSCTCGKEGSSIFTHGGVKHTLTHHDKVDAKCTTDGYEEYWSCSECLILFDSENATHIIAGPEVIEKLGHHEVTDERVEPTCISTGLTEGTHCDRCHVVLLEQEIIQELEHEYTCQVIDDKYLASEANCISSAKYYYSCTCGLSNSQTFNYGSVSQYHTFELELYTSNVVQHAKKCDLCSYTKDEENHTFENGTCVICNQKLVKLNSISSCQESAYTVFDEVTLSLEEVIREFDISVYIENCEDSNIETLVLQTLGIKAYLYLSVEQFEESEYDEDWFIEEHPYTKINVYNFQNNLPITSGTGSEIGYLIDNQNFVTINKTPTNWKFLFNVPVEKCHDGGVYFQFKVLGIDYSNTEIIEKTSFTQIGIDIEHPNYQDNDTHNIYFDNLKNKMALNDYLENAEDYPEQANVQVIKINTDDIENYNEVSYKSVMYFVEKQSNDIDGSKKIISVGNYCFTNLNGDYYKVLGDDLIGERIPTYNQNGECYIQAINASTEPIKIFAVIYLSDKDGNPIDGFGNRIILNEEDDCHENCLVVINISELTEITIDNFIEEINYYKIIEEEKMFTDTFGFEAGYVKINYRQTFWDECLGEDITDEELVRDINDFLRLQLIVEEKVELGRYYDSPIPTMMYLSVFNLNGGGEIIEEDKYAEFTFKHYLEGVLTDYTCELGIITYNNKQIAFNNFCNSFEDNYVLETSGMTTDINYEILKHNGEQDCYMIAFEISVEGCDSLSDRIFIDIQENMTDVYSPEMLVNYDWSHGKYFEYQYIYIPIENKEVE